MLLSLLAYTALAVPIPLLNDYKIEQEHIQPNYEEEVISYISNLNNIGYRLGCYGQRGCNNTFDCSGLIYSFLIKKNIPVITKRNSTGLYNLGEKKSVYDVKRGDIVYFSSTNGGINHIALALGGYDNGVIQIIDNVSKRKLGMNNRALKIYGQGENKYYKYGKNIWKISISSNSVADAYKAYMEGELHPLVDPNHTHII